MLDEAYHKADDAQANLRLELRHADEQIVELRGSINSKEAELSKLRQRETEVSAELATLKKLYEDLHHSVQQSPDQLQIILLKAKVNSLQASLDQVSHICVLHSHLSGKRSGL